MTNREVAILLIQEGNSPKTQWPLVKNRNIIGREADAGLDDGTDQRTPLHPGELAAARNAEARAAEGRGKRRRHGEIEQAQPGELREFIQVALQRRDQRRQVRAKVLHRP